MVIKCVGTDAIHNWSLSCSSGKLPYRSPHIFLSISGTQTALTVVLSCLGQCTRFLHVSHQPVFPTKVRMSSRSLLASTPTITLYNSTDRHTSTLFHPHLSSLRVHYPEMSVALVACLVFKWVSLIMVTPTLQL